jgi:hypothetical protein
MIIHNGTDAAGLVPGAGIAAGGGSGARKITQFSSSGSLPGLLDESRCRLPP